MCCAFLVGKSCLQFQQQNIIYNTHRSGNKDKQNRMQTGTNNSIHELLQLFKHYKTNSGDPKLKDISALSFSSKNFESTHRHPLDSISIENSNNIHSRINKSSFNPTSRPTENVFNKLYHQKRQMEMRRCRLEYETRRSKEEKQRNQCTFIPNIRSRLKMRTEFDSIQYSNTNANDDTFYLKNIEWMERKDQNIKKLQCEKNQENANQFTFTPRINKRKKQANPTRQDEKLLKNPGVGDYLQRQQKAKKNQEYVKDRQKNPYSHVWTVKQGQVSRIK